MGGTDKTRLALAGRSLLAHVAARIAPQVAALAVSAPAPRPDLPGLPTLPDTVPDTVPERPGPLAGILAGLEWAAAAGFAALLSVPGDTPFLPPDLAARLAAAATRDTAPGAVAASAGRVHPVVALWPVAAAASIRAALIEHGARRVRDLTAGFAVVDWPALPVDPFFNVNTPDDFAEAARLLAAYPSFKSPSTGSV
jgi:molybdopterin-guanine dinucleotide biosynthesis protein A